MKRNSKKFQTDLKLTLALAALVLLMGYAYLNRQSDAELPAAGVKVTIEPGSSLFTIARQLEAAGVIADARCFSLVAIMTGKMRKLQAGTYEFKEPLRPGAVLEILTSGKVMYYKLTIPEGANIYDIADMVAASGRISRREFLAAALSPATARRFGIDAPSMEGFLYPETYYLTDDTDTLKLMERMVAQFRDFYPPAYQERARVLGLSTLEVITLASMIEKEAVDPADKPLISSVFHNRLKQNMRLQSDPTAVYGIPDFKGRIYPRHLRRQSAYNTYRHRGLPPGPICNPDRDSIKAALYPTASPYLYFVATGGGRHTFTTSLEDHNRAVHGPTDD
ncbi:MAG: putative aminodeoxychorismate lyase [Deltaproteobacteria bacterium ADurb.Bin510]|nr:MAG: putative aminodeoxychorismate lyase [Deltaproteobacteria bacterium ADurb.Bin510]